MDIAYGLVRRYAAIHMHMKHLTIHRGWFESPKWSPYHWANHAPTTLLNHQLPFTESPKGEDTTTCALSTRPKISVTTLCKPNRISNCSH